LGCPRVEAQFRGRDRTHWRRSCCSGQPKPEGVRHPVGQLGLSEHDSCLSRLGCGQGLLHERWPMDASGGVHDAVAERYSAGRVRMHSLLLDEAFLLAWRTGQDNGLLPMGISRLQQPRTRPDNDKLNSNGCCIVISR